MVAYDGETPVGCAGFQRYDHTTAEVKRVFIKSEYRGRGISKKLMEGLEQRARDQDYSRLILETGKPLVCAVRLYQRIGYRRIPNDGPYKEISESVCMEKDL